MINSENEMYLEEIIKEFIKLNPDKNIEAKKIKENINDINNEFKTIKANENTVQYDFNVEILDLKINEPIFQNSDSDSSFIAKMIYYHEKIFGFFPRTIQIISLLYFIEKNKKEGLIQQINTGEGKSVIISFLAVYIARKKNKKIDILTSSPVLAKRDSIYFKKFYEKCGLSVDYTFPHNNENFKNYFTSNNYKCYDSDIVYGDALSFEGDFLRTNFMGIKGRGYKRHFDCIIIDEIDNIALDNLKNTTELLDSFHGYKFLEYIYLFIYKTLTEIEKSIKKNIVEEKENIVKKLYEISLNEFKDIKKLKKEKNIFIPNNLENYIKDRLNDWCESAYIAKFIFKNNENYIIKKSEDYGFEEICPIDFYNTGVTQENSIWSGLHQFLQIKEGKILTEENLSSCYISNLSFFNKYIIKDNNSEIIENNIYGLTGTIGSKYNIKTLDKLYNLNVLLIPPFKKSKLIIEKPIIILSNTNNNKLKNNKTEDLDSKWRKEIIEKIFELIGSNRSVLIVFQYISECDEMYDFMNGLKNNKNKPDKIIKYSRSDIEEENEFLKKQIEPKTLIISTNLAGRGTDIKISETLNNNNGLHVILTYEPFNERIENQAFGRAARKGQNGSAGKIIVCPYSNDEIILKREEREKEESDFLINVYKYKIEVFEEIFSKFTKYLENIYSKYKIEKSKYSDNDIKRKDQEILLLDIKERWGLFLIKNNLNNIEKKYRKNHNEIKPDMFITIKKNYDIFEKELNQFCFSSFLDEKKNENDELKNKIQYKFINALYLNKSLNESRIDSAIETDKNFALGSYMFKLKNYFSKILNLKIKNKNNNEIDIISNNIKVVFEKLNELLKNFVKHYEKCNDISLQLCDKSSDFIKQSNTKKLIMQNIYELMNQNYNIFNKFIKNKELKLKFKELNTKNFIIKHLNNQFNKIEEEYFSDFGFRLFIIDVEGNNCINF